MPKLVMTKGLPASGKSTWAKEQVAQSKGQAKRINKDDLRDMIDNGKWSKRNEQYILQVRDSLIEHYLEGGFNVIVDDTNLHSKHETRLRELSARHSATFEVKDFTDVPTLTCIERDLKRPHSVGHRVINSMFNQFLRPSPRAIDYRPGLGNAIICDIDGTLAHMQGRSPYDWNKVDTDTVDDNIRNLLWDLSESYTIILMSGRDGIARPLTLEWLDVHGIPYEKLLMRAEGDERKDYIVKRELFEQNVEGKYNVQFVLDDRDQVVDMWRNELGLKCLQVAEGDF